MHWQDFVIFSCFIFFNIALIPSLKSHNKPAIATSLITGGLNFVMSFTQTTLGLWLSSIASFINALLWMALAYQKYKQK